MNSRLNIKKWRKLRKMSQKTLSNRLNTSQGYISELEWSLKSPSVRMLYQIAQEFDICPRLMLNCIIECSKCNREFKCICEGE
jgi:Predicted transcriptional regulator